MRIKPSSSMKIYLFSNSLSQLAHCNMAIFSRSKRSSSEHSDRLFTCAATSNCSGSSRLQIKHLAALWSPTFTKSECRMRYSRKSPCSARNFDKVKLSLLYAPVSRSLSTFSLILRLRSSSFIGNWPAQAPGTPVTPLSSV